MLKNFHEEWKTKTERKNHKKYKCDHCDKTFLVATTMNNHLIVDHENVKMEDTMKKHVKAYQCEILLLLFQQYESATLMKNVR